MWQRRLGRVVGTLVICVILAKVLVYSRSGDRWILRAPRFEPLLYSEKEWSCEFPDLSARSDAVVLVESDHDQFEHFHNIRFVFQAPWERTEVTARLVETVQVRATLQSTSGPGWTGKTISYAHHISILGLSGCSLREGVLRRGQHVLFLHEDPPVGSGRFRLSRDLQAATLFVTGILEQTLVPEGRSTRDRILSVFRDAALLQGSMEASGAAGQWAALIRSWQLETEYEPEWERITHSRTIDAGRLKDFCAAGVSTFWWTAGGCDESGLRENIRPSEALRSRNHPRLFAGDPEWRRELAERYSAELAGRILARIRASR